MEQELALHEEKCDYRKINCVIWGCKEDICYLKFSEHIDSIHKDKGIYVRLALMKQVTLCTKSVTIIKFQKESESES